MKYVAPVDPDCPKVKEFYEAINNDPMSIFAPLDEIIEDFRVEHMRECSRCKDYGLANIDIE